MKKKALLGIGIGILVLIVLISIWQLVKEKPPVGVLSTPKELTHKELIEKKAEIVAVGYGWSVKNDEVEAIDQAVSMAKKGLAGKEPEFALLFSNAAYNSEKIIKEAKKLLPNTQIYGGTSMLGVLTRDGFHQGEKASLALMVISSPKMDFGVGGANVDDFPSAKEAGKEAILSAIKNAGKEGELPQLVLMTGSVGNEEKIISGIEEVIGKEIPIIGGSSADNDLTGKWKQFATDKVYSNGVALTAIFTDLKIGWAYEAGYFRTENRGIITKAEGRTIYEIDNRPAAEVYNEWTGGIVSEKLKTGGPILAKTAFYPLAKIITGRHMETHYLSIHPLSVNLPEKSLTVFTNVKKGEKILLMHGSWELLLNRAQITPLKALTSKGIAKGEGYFGIYTYCAGTMLAIPKEERPKMPLLVNNVLGDIPFIGTFTFGEEGLLKGVGNEHGNLVNSMIVFGPEE